MGRGDSGKGPEGRRVRVAQELLFQHGILRFRSPRTHRSWHQIRSKHRYLRSGLLRGLGTRWLQHQSTPQTEKHDWTQPSRHARRGHEMVRDQIRRHSFEPRQEGEARRLRFQEEGKEVNFRSYFEFDSTLSLVLLPLPSLVLCFRLYIFPHRRFPTALASVIENVGLLNFKTELFVRSSSQLYHRCRTATFSHRFKLNYDFQGFLMGHFKLQIQKKSC